MNKITSSKMDVQKLARLVKDIKPKTSANAGAVAEMKATVEGLVNDPAKILAPTYSADVKAAKEFLATQAAQIKY